MFQSRYARRHPGGHCLGDGPSQSLPPVVAVAIPEEWPDPPRRLMNELISVSAPDGAREEFPHIESVLSEFTWDVEAAGVAANAAMGAGGRRVGRTDGNSL